MTSILINNTQEYILEFEQKLSFEVSDPYYYIKKEAISKETCQEIIELFENSDNHPGRTVSGLDNSVKRTFEVNIVGNEWSKIDNILCNCLTNALIDYGNQIIKVCNNNIILCYLNNNRITDTGYQIQKYIKYDGFYDWHNDNIINHQTSQRIISFIWYLNDIEEGGETLFYNGKIKPEAGKLLLFPATWTYNHKGNMPKSHDKYIITGWVYN
jgi:hypothetical protein